MAQPKTPAVSATEKFKLGPEEMQDIQRGLNIVLRGQEPLAITGQLDEETRAALRAFQIENPAYGLARDGRPTAKTMAALDAEREKIERGHKVANHVGAMPADAIKAALAAGQGISGHTAYITPGGDKAMQDALAAIAKPGNNTQLG